MKNALSQQDLKAINDRIKNIPQEKQKYYKDIPFTDKQKEISRNRILTSLKTAGDIYLEELKDTIKAIETFESILKRFPSSKYDAEMHYNLYMLYYKKNKIDKADYHKKIINEKYPDSEYAMLIIDPEYFSKKLKMQNISAKIYYESIYNFFITGKCHELIDSVKKAKKDYGFSMYYPKMLYLSIICSGKDTTQGGFHIHAE